MPAGYVDVPFPGWKRSPNYELSAQVHLPAAQQLRTFTCKTSAGSLLTHQAPCHPASTPTHPQMPPFRWGDLSGYSPNSGHTWAAKTSALASHPGRSSLGVPSCTWILGPTRRSNMSHDGGSWGLRTDEQSSSHLTRTPRVCTLRLGKASLAGRPTACHHQTLAGNVPSPRGEDTQMPSPPADFNLHPFTGTCGHREHSGFQGVLGPSPEQQP